MGRIIALVYGIGAYALFLATFLYAIGFVTGLVVPKTIDSGVYSPVTETLAINLGLLALFAIQHSVMARPQFKAWWTRFVPSSVERSTYVLLSNGALILLFWQWRPVSAVVWEVDNPYIAAALTALSLAGWLIVVSSTFLLNHFELFGLQQVATNLTRSSMPQEEFRTPAYYRLVRHPIYLGFVIAFWAAPKMTVGHLLFAATTTVYILLAIQLEERDLVAVFGDDYRRYKQRVSMLFPWRKTASVGGLRTHRR